MAAPLENSAELLNSLQQELQAKSLMLAELELIIEDYERERSKLLKELTALKERILDLTEGKEPQKRRK